MSKNLKNIVEKVKACIIPPKKAEEKVKLIMKKIDSVAENIGKKYGFKPMFCGSVAKGTWLMPVEMDLFLLFPENIERSEFEEVGLKAAKEISKALNAKWEKKYTEHPYLRAFLQDVQLDIVPCYDVPPQRIKSAVDRTPWHVRYVREKLEEWQKDEVRLLKVFCKAQEVYGADIVHHGFSGYLCELLIIKFGSFINLVKSATKWNPQVILYLEKPPKKEILDSFSIHPLVFIDPVDENRNVAAAVSFKSFFKFVKACRKLVSSPSESMFRKRFIPISQKKLERILTKRNTKFYVLLFPAPKDLHEDIIVAQLRKLAKLLSENLSREGFLIHRIEEFFLEKEAGIIIESEIWKLPVVMKRIGPSVFSKHAKEFLVHYSDKYAWIENGVWVVEDKRKFLKIEEFLKCFFSGSEKSLKERGVPSKLAKLSKEMRIYIGDSAIVSLAKKKKEFAAFLKKYFEESINPYEVQI